MRPTDGITIRMAFLSDSSGTPLESDALSAATNTPKFERMFPRFAQRAHHTHGKRRPHGENEAHPNIEYLHHFRSCRSELAEKVEDRRRAPPATVDHRITVPRQYASDVLAQTTSGDVRHSRDHAFYPIAWFFGMLSFKALCAFAALFGLTGLALADSTMPARLIGATAAGAAAMLVVAFLMRSLSRLGASGTVDIRNAVGSTAAVYLTIPGAGAGAGKVTVEIQGRSMQLSAVTDGEQITTGARVMVMEVTSGDTLKVTRT